MYFCMNHNVIRILGWDFDSRDKGLAEVLLRFFEACE